MYTTVTIRGFYVSCDVEGSVSITTGTKLEVEGILIDYNNPSYKEVIDIIKYYDSLSLIELTKCVKEWI